MKHDLFEQSSERKQAYIQRLKDTSDGDLVQCFVESYLAQDFHTDFDKWMAEADVFELKRRLVMKGRLTA